jgi:hypothetical protein
MTLFCCPYDGTGLTCSIHGPKKITHDRICFNCGEPFVLSEGKHTCPHCGINVVPQPGGGLGMQMRDLFRT